MTVSDIDASSKKRFSGLNEAIEYLADADSEVAGFIEPLDGGGIYVSSLKATFDGYEETIKFIENSGFEVGDKQIETATEGAVEIGSLSKEFETVSEFVGLLEESPVELPEAIHVCDEGEVVVSDHADVSASTKRSVLKAMESRGFLQRENDFDSVWEAGIVLRHFFDLDEREADGEVPEEPDEKTETFINNVVFQKNN